MTSSPRRDKFSKRRTSLVEEFADIGEAIARCSSLNVDINHCKTQEEIEDMLRFYYMKKEGTMAQMEEVRSVSDL